MHRSSFSPCPPSFGDTPRVPRREHIVPVALMAETLVGAHADLGDERLCAEALTSRGFLASDIASGLSQSIDLARGLRARTDTVLTIGRDLACVAVFCAGILIWAA